MVCWGRGTVGQDIRQLHWPHSEMITYNVNNKFISFGWVILAFVNGLNFICVLIFKFSRLATIKIVMTAFFVQTEN